MFSSKLGRVAQRATATSASSFSASTCTAAHRTTQSIATRASSHQRRPSSSKASVPPDSSKPGPAPAEKAKEEVAVQPQRKHRRLGKAARVPQVQQAAKKRQQAELPKVPDVQHLDKRDVILSNFFSLHRPLSVTTTIPPPSTEEAFNNVFDTKPERDAWADGNSAERRPEDVIYTLHNMIETLESQSNAAQEETVPWEALQDSQFNNGSIKHLDGQPQIKSLEELVSQFKPFRAPPPPQPFPEEPKAAASARKASLKQRKQQHAPMTKTYQTTLTVVEVTDSNGKKVYTPSQSPIITLTDPALISQQLPRPQRPMQPFLERMRRRQQMFLQAQHSKILARIGEPQRPEVVRKAPSARRMKMILISVKRQRKLKMKKHKYKKLMKRTRNLRRRLDRN